MRHCNTAGLKCSQPMADNHCRAAAIKRRVDWHRMGAVVIATAIRARQRTAMPSRKPFTVLIVSTNPNRRGALAHCMWQYGARQVIETANPAEARARARIEGSQDLCLIDGTAADGPILPLVQDLRALGWRRVVVFTGRDDAYAVRAAIGAGIRGFVVAQRSGTRYAPRAAIPQQRNRARSSPDELSAREIEVLQSVAEGRSNKEIGEVLGLSALTVKSHLARIARKLGTGDRAEMVAVTMRAGTVR